MKRVFVDTGGFFALLAADDRNHERARALFERASRERWRLGHDECRRDRDVHASARANAGGIAFLDGLGALGVRIERVRASDEQRAVDLVRHHRDKAYSLCDAFGFVVMQRLGIVEAIAFDRHFREYGKFTVL